MEDLLKTLLEPLVSDLKKIKIEKEVDGKYYRFLVSVPKDDIAKVIGKSGKMVKAIKHLVQIRAIKEGLFVNIEVQEL